MSNRNIRYDPECDTAAELLGGYEAIDESLDAIAVGTRITARPPHRTVRAEFPHTAPTLGV